MAAATDKYCNFNATLAYSALDEKYYLQCPGLNINYIMYRNVSFVYTWI